MDKTPDRPTRTLTEDLSELIRDTPELGSRAEELDELCRVLGVTGKPSEVDGWTELDLVSTYARPESFDPVPQRRGWLRAGLDIAPSVLVFVPVLLTWIGLIGASTAYRTMLGDPAAREANAGRSFLELWQGGFAGRLWGPLHFDLIATYTAVTLGVLIVVTVAGLWLRRGDEARAAARSNEVLRRLLPVLTRAQLELNRRRLSSPARFAAELSSAAAQLGELLRQVARTHDSTAELARHNEQAATSLRGSIETLNAATVALNATGMEVRGATTALHSASEVLREEVTVRAAGAADRLDRTAQATAAEVARLQAAGQQTLDQASTRIGTTLDQASTRIGTTLDQVAEQVGSILDQVAGRVGSTLDQVADRIERATGRLVDAGDGFAATIGTSATEAAREVGDTYQEAVAVAAAALAARMAEVSADLTGAVQAVREATERHGDAAREAAERHTGAARLVETTGTAQAETWRRAAEAIGASMAGLSDSLATHTATVRAADDGIAARTGELVAVAGRLDDLARRMQSAAERIGDSLGGLDASVARVHDGVSRFTETAARTGVVQEASADGLATAVARHADEVNQGLRDAGAALRDDLAGLRPLAREVAGLRTLAGELAAAGDRLAESLSARPGSGRVRPTRSRPNRVGAVRGGVGRSGAGRGGPRPGRVNGSGPAPTATTQLDTDHEEVDGR